jgi:hypothetical protein
MASSAMLRRVALIRTDVSEGLSSSFIKVTIGASRLLVIANVVRFEVFTAVTMKNGVFWVATPCGSCKNRRFGGIWCLLHQGDKNR